MAMYMVINENGETMGCFTNLEEAENMLQNGNADWDILKYEFED